ncbi:MAG: hypothetical protein HMLKMBBP_02614 [Planctomycetes bacterium]|nr:hypothetical protein [Planctomycetota bacterium]
MTQEEAVRLRAVLDRLVREKEIAAQYFVRAAGALGEVEQRRWFRRMAQDEKDQRKILMKHRRELCAQVGPSNAPPQTSATHKGAEGWTRTPETGFAEVVRTAAMLAEESRIFAQHASDLTTDRSCRIFLKILAQESGVRRDELVREIRRIESEETVAA